ncbi:MAG TPA: PrsW family intramembrane metalloprotease [Chloroflexia bacterium]|nr:PrsW family intramembrane metalloprotease [Chloroflexia bacterium]
MDFAILIVVAALLALVPTLIYALIIWWLDRHEKEPLPLLIVAFVWGAIPAVVLAIVLEIVVGMPLEQFMVSDTAIEAASTNVIAPVVEELVKAVILIVLFLAYKREFDNVLDGIVYGAMVGLGFAFVENILYLGGEALDGGSLGSMVSLWIFRAGLFGLNHSMFTAMTGAALGLARSLRQPALKGLVPVLGMIAAIVFHAAHNTLVTQVASMALEDSDLTPLLGACVAIFAADWGGIVLVFVLAMVSSSREAHVMRETLIEEVALGRFTPDEYETLVSGRKRWSARWAVLFTRGFRPWRQLGKFFDLATELAFRKHRMHDGDLIHRNISAKDVAKLRSQIDELKSVILSGA